MWWRRRRERELADARAEALRWYERLGGQIANLPSGDDAATKQAMVDAGERYNAAGSQMEQAESPKQYELARETALEGLAYIRAARVSLGLDPGPDLPPLAGQRTAGAITQERELDVQGRRFKASPQPTGDTPYYHPGGSVRGRPVPAGWYSEPWWRTALVAGAFGVGSFLLFDALSGGFGANDQGFQEGLDYAEQHGWEPGGESDAGADAGQDAGAADYGQDAGAADYGAADYGGGDFGGGDFGGGDFGGF
jgi:hypothetical protein